MTSAMPITPTETPTPMPAFAPVDNPERVEVEVEVGVEVSVGVDVDTMSLDCHAIPTGIAWIRGVGYVTAVVAVGVGSPNEYVIVVTPLLLIIQGSRSYQDWELLVATSKPLNVGKVKPEARVWGYT